MNEMFYSLPVSQRIRLKNAIKIYTKEGQEIGFEAKDWATILAYKMDRIL
ncbi:HIRAN domain-containing protein [Paenibacillus polymyxa]|nr:HIRAN domain-containing protein [Paenibacillus polymyxa]